MRMYQQPTIQSVRVCLERGFEVSDPDMNYGDGGDAWDN